MGDYVESGYVEAGYFAASEPAPLPSPPSGGGTWRDVYLFGKQREKRLKSKRDEELFIFKP